MSYAIVFSSKTGNTRLLADTLRASLPQNECTYFGAPAPEALEAETLYIGFWTDKGHADDTLTAFLQTLKDIDRNGYEGIGKPERLSGDLSSYWSRRIDDANRIVYRIDGNVVKIVQCGSHYRDK